MRTSGYATYAATPNYRFGILNNSGTEYFSILGSNGNIGINSTAPGARLNVYGSDTSNSTLNMNVSGQSGTGLVVTNLNRVGIGQSAPANLLSVAGSISAGSYSGTAAPTNGMIIDGNVGIGNSTGAEKLQVTGNIRLDKSATAYSGQPYPSFDLKLQSSSFDSYYSTEYLQNFSLRTSGYATYASQPNYRFGILNNSGTEYFSILGSNGNVGINTTAPGYKLTLNGQPAANGYTAWTNYSDARLKENITPMVTDSSLNKILQIQPVTFNYNQLTGYDEATRNRRISGFIAQDLMRVFPEMVGTTTINSVQYYDTNLSDLPLYLVQAFKDVNNIITFATAPTSTPSITIDNAGNVGIGQGLNIGSSLNVSGTATIGALTAGTSTFASLAASSAVISTLGTDQLSVNNLQLSGNLTGLMSSAYLNNLTLTGNLLATSSHASFNGMTLYGNVGIGLENPGSKLDIYEAVSSSTMPVDLFRLMSDVNGSHSIKFRVDTNGDIYTDGTLHAMGGADVAEYYPVLEQGLQPGEVVAMVATTTDVFATGTDGSLVVTGTTTVTGLMRTDVGHRTAFGVITTKPGMLLGQNTASSAPVALIGQAPVKVTDENGSILAGDYLVPSRTLPGYAMKATYSGTVIGQALADFVPTSTPAQVTPYVPATSTIISFVKPQFQNVNNTFVLGEDEGQLTGQVGGVPTTSPAAMIINQKGSGNLLQVQQNGMDRFMINNSGTVVLNGNATTTSQLFVVTNASSSVFSINSVGDLYAKGHIKVGHDTAGTATIKSGDNATEVTFDMPYGSVPKVMVTPTDVPVTYAVTHKTEGGFTIVIDKTYSQDISFDWFVVEQPDQTNSRSTTLQVYSEPVVQQSSGSQASTGSGNGQVAGASTSDAGTQTAPADTGTAAPAADTGTTSGATTDTATSPVSVADPATTVTP